jgi:hypothetical protein
MKPNMSQSQTAAFSIIQYDQKSLQNLKNMNQNSLHKQFQIDMIIKQH